MQTNQQRFVTKATHSNDDVVLSNATAIFENGRMPEINSAKSSNEVPNIAAAISNTTGETRGTAETGTDSSITSGVSRQLAQNVLPESFTDELAHSQIAPNMGPC